MSWLSTSGLARITARHPWRTILVWVVILAVFGWQASMIGNRTTSDFKFNTKPESVKGFGSDRTSIWAASRRSRRRWWCRPTRSRSMIAEFQNAVTATHRWRSAAMPDLVTDAVRATYLS